MANNVLFEEFYRSSDLAIEKKKFKNFNNDSKNRDIYALRNKIKGKNNEKSNRSETQESLAQKARQRMMSKNTDTIIRKTTIFNSTVKHTNKLPFLNVKQNFNNSKIKDNSPNTSVDKIQGMENQNNLTHNNRDCKKYYIIN